MEKSPASSREAQREPSSCVPLREAAGGLRVALCQRAAALNSEGLRRKELSEDQGRHPRLPQNTNKTPLQLGKDFHIAIMKNGAGGM
jgi:hypothetical protein